MYNEGCNTFLSNKCLSNTSINRAAASLASRRDWRHLIQQQFIYQCYGHQGNSENVYSNSNQLSLTVNIGSSLLALPLQFRKHFGSRGVTNSPDPVPKPPNDALDPNESPGCCCGGAATILMYSQLDGHLKCSLMALSRRLNPKRWDSRDT